MIETTGVQIRRVTPMVEKTEGQLQKFKSARKFLQ